MTTSLRLHWRFESNLALISLKGIIISAPNYDPGFQLTGEDHM